MTVLVETSEGLIDRDQLIATDNVHETQDARVIETVWVDTTTNKEVRRDVTISILRGLDLEKSQGV